MNKRMAKEFDELDSAIELRVYTKCPDKWILFDAETHRVFRGDASGSWVELLSKGE